MQVIEVKDRFTATEFIELPRFIYHNDPHWVRHLDKDIADVFDTQLNPYYQNGEAMRWILKKDSKTIGRIAAFYSSRFKSPDAHLMGGIGFFECINNADAAKLLFDTAVEWLKGKGFAGAYGPINFGEKDRFWGLMVQGFKNPSYLENYNPAYYQQLFENYGFKKTVEQTTSEITRESFNYERFSRISQRVLNNPNYRFVHYTDNNLDQFANDFVSIYNQAWAHRPDFNTMTLERVRAILKSLRPILLEEIIWFVYANNEPAGFYINVIDVNQIFKHLHGKMNWLGKIKFLWYRYFGTITRCRGIVFGVIPKYQNLGLETGMIIRLYEMMSSFPHLKASELAWIGDFNPKMHSLFDALGAKTTKVHYTYQYLFEK
jgi:hypothetical protein